MVLTVPKNPCDPSDTGTKPFGPSGPRGWQDEYCEWAVTRDENGDIIAVDFMRTLNIGFICGKYLRI
jgi:hypothetical protein